MKLPPKMPQRAMVRIWVASLHQKDQRRKYAGLFLLQKTKVTPLRVDSNSCGPALASRRAKKPQWGFFSSAARRDTRAHQKDQRRKYAGFFFCKKPKVTPSRVDLNSCGPALAARRAKKPQWGFFSSAARRDTRAHQKSATPPVPDPLRHFASEMPPLPEGEALAVRKGLLAFIKISPHCIHTTAKVTAVCYIKKTTRKTSGFLYTTKQRRCKTVSAKCFIQRILGRCQKRLSPRSGSCRSSQRGQAGPHRAAWWGRYLPDSLPHAA